MALPLLLFAATVVHERAAPPADISTADVVAAFQQLCMPEFPDTAAIASKARSTGWTQIDTRSRPRHFKGLTFERDNMVFLRSAFIAELGSDAKDITRNKCGVSAALRDGTLTQLAEEAAAALALPPSKPGTTDNEVEWSFQNGRMVRISVGGAKPKSAGPTANITISAPKAVH